MSFSFPEKKKDDALRRCFGGKKPKNYENGEQEIPSDVLGSYTGTAYDDLFPVQDADDL